MSEPPVSVGLVTRDSAVHLPACLAALAAQTYPRLELILVDNASRDGSPDLVADRFPAARVLRNARNEGFSRAHNTAIATSGGAYYLALNPDARLEPDYVAGLVGALEARPAFGAAAGKLRLPEGGPRPILDAAGLSIGRDRRPRLRGHGRPDDGRYDRAGEVFGVDGAAPLYRRAMLEDARLGGEVFDEAFFAYREDVDLAWRARLLGWRAWYEAGVRATHVRGFRPGTRGPSRAARRYSVRNRYLLLMKNETAPGWRRDWPAILGYDLIILGYLAARERSSLPALAELPRLWPPMRAKRRELMARLRVDPAAPLCWFR